MASKALTSRKAVLLYGAVTAAVLPKLASDAKVDLVTAFDGVTRANAKNQAKSIATKVVALTKGKLAADAELDADDVLEMVKTMAGVDNGEPDEDDLAEDEDDEDDMSKDEVPKDEDDRPEATDAEMSPEMKDKKAMDAAIAAAVANALKSSESRIKLAADAAAKATVARIDALNAARAQVLPHVGDVMGLDSAEAVYRFAFDKLDMDVSDVHPSAFPAMMRLVSKPGATPIAQDAAQAATGDDWFDKHFGVRASANA
jgi:hypothetical protein